MNFINKKIILAVTALFAFTATMAQDVATTSGKSDSQGSNQMVWLLVLIAGVLAFVIWGLGQVLLVLTREVMEKEKKATGGIAALLIIGLLLSQTTSAQNTTLPETVNKLPNYGGLSSTTFYVFVAVISIEIIAILFFAFSIRSLLRQLSTRKVRAVAKESKLKIWWAAIDKKFFTKAVPVEKEAAILLDHDYDGIRELDNALPPWWKYGFYITIVIACIYLLNFHVLGYGKNPAEEYKAEMENARIEKELYDANNKDKVDENNVPMADASGIKAGQDMFEANCIACHLKGGAGNVGPNLTDDYWLHKGSLNDIFKSIKNGYPEKGMQSWSTKFNPKEISLLASYIKSIKGSNPPNAKLPQGDLYVETAPVASKDSTKK